MGTAMQVYNAAKHRGGLPATTLDVVQFNRARLAEVLARIDRLKTTLGNVFNEKILEIRYGQTSQESDSLHVTSANAAQVHTRPRNLVKFLAEQPLKLRIDMFEKMDAAVIVRKKRVVPMDVPRVGENEG